MEGERQEAYRHDAHLLSEVGAALAHAKLPNLEVHLPKPLAEQAVAAWQRRDSEGPLGEETCEQRVQRQRAGTLALIGLSIAERGQWVGNDVVVELDPVFIGLAIDAADDLPSM